MDYKEIYASLCVKALKRSVNSDYKEKHHIIPKCLGGSNKKENLVHLTPREHYFAHKLLCRIYPENFKLSFALMCMSSDGSKSAVGHKITSREYEINRSRFSELVSKYHPMKGKFHNEETRIKMSKSSPRLSGDMHPMFGKKHGEESKIKMSLSSRRLSGENHAMFARKQSDEARKKMSDAYGKRVHTQWNFDKNKYTFKNSDTGEVFFGLRFDFCKKYGFSTSSGGLTRLIKSNQKTFKGWTLEKIGNDSTT